MERLIRWSLCSAVLLTTTTASAALLGQGQSCGEASCGEVSCGEGCNTCEGCDSRSGKGGNGKNKSCHGNEGIYRLSKRQSRKLNERCPSDVRWQAAGLDWAHDCGPIGTAARMGIPGAKCVRDCWRTKGAGDSGWSPPSRMPVNRTNTGFSSYSNLGNSYVGAPMVYQPTDTAQLGYSYAHVPTWQRNPRMIPRTPSPSMFHARVSPQPAYSSGSYCSAGCSTGACMGGQVIDGYSGGSYCPSCQASATPRPTQHYTVAAKNVQRPQAVQPAAMPQKPRELQPVRAVAASRPAPAAKPIPVVSNQTTEIVLPAPQPVPIQVRTPAAKPPAAARANTQQRTVQQPRTQRQPVRRVTRQRKAPQKSGGWLGLPSLAEMKF